MVERGKALPGGRTVGGHVGECGDVMPARLAHLAVCGADFFGKNSERACRIGEAAATILACKQGAQPDGQDGQHRDQARPRSEAQHDRRWAESALAKDLSDQYFIDSPSFAQAASAEPGLANYALRNEAGQTIGWFTWRPDRPGALILSETLPAMSGALAISGVVLVLLLRGLRRTTAALEEGKAKAEYQANHDVLTGLANRAHFNKRLEEALTASPRDNSSIALLALDLDRFKQVNDTLGHEAGDQLLREVGRRLTPLVDDEDTVARLGGDEFAIIQRGVHAADEVSALSSRIIAELSAPFALAGRVAQIGVSIGVVITPASQAASDLASKADIALYEAKASGRNTFRIFEDAMQKAAQFREKVGDEMRTANLPAQRQRVA